MPILRLLPLFVLPVLVGATCVSRVDQKGPAGPWIGEVINGGATVAPDVHVYGWFQDADGGWAGILYTRTCPFDLLPGQKGYFFRSAIEISPELALPFHVASAEAYTCQQHSLTTDVTLRIVSISEDHKSARVEAQNNSQNTYYGLNVCGVSFTSSGGIQGVADSSLPVAILKPGDKVKFPLNFATAVDRPIEFAVESTFGTYDAVLDSTHFKVSASRIVTTDQGRELQIVGEVSNDSHVDLTGARYEIYLASTPATRVSGTVAPYGVLHPGEISVWATGFIPAGGKAPVVFALPLNRGDSTSVRFNGAVASSEAETATPFVITNVSSIRFRPDLVNVTATVTNPFNEHAVVDSICFELRGADGELVGASCRDSCGMGAHESWTISQGVVEIAQTQTVDVVAYGHPGMCHIVPPSDPGPPPCGPLPNPRGTPISPD